MERSLSATKRRDKASTLIGQKRVENINKDVNVRGSSGYDRISSVSLENENCDSSSYGNTLGSTFDSSGKSVNIDAVNSDVFSKDNMVKTRNIIKCDRAPSDVHNIKVEYEQRHSNDSKARENNINRNRSLSCGRNMSEEKQINNPDIHEAERNNPGLSKRENTEVPVSTEKIQRSSSVDKNRKKTTAGIRNQSNDRTRKGQESPRHKSENINRRGQYSPRNLSSDRSRRGQGFQRNTSSDRTRRGNFSNDRTGRGKESPRETVLVQKAPKGIDTSLALGDLEGSDDDEDDMSPRKASPRKETVSGLMQTTKSFEAKTSLIRRQGSDSSLTKYMQKQSNSDKNELSSKPFIKKSLSSNPLRIDFMRKHSTSEDDDIDRKQASEVNEVKPVLDKSLHRSSGRKLPTPNEHLRPFNKTFHISTSTSDINEQLNSGKSTSLVETDVLVNKSSQTDTYKTVDIDHTNNIPSSPRERKVNLKRSASVEGTVGHYAAESTVISKKPPSPRDGRSVKPPLEKKILARSASTSAVSSSPRGTTVPSPRGSKPPSPRSGKPPSPRNGKPPSPRNTSRTTVPSPRGSTVPSPRGIYKSNELVRKSSLERKVNSDKGLPRRNSSSSLELNSKELGKRTSGGVLGSFKSPRSSSPTKSGKKFLQKTDKIAENFVLEINGIDNCMDLQAVLAKVQVSAAEMEESKQVIT